MSSNKPAITVRGLSKSYTIRRNQPKHTTLADALVDWVKRPLRRTEKEVFWALRNLNFEVAQGEIVGLIGRNGAGKSTLLKILSRITRPTSGEVELHGRVGSLLEVGTGFHQELTGRENIFLSGTILGLKRQEIIAQFDAIVDFSGVEQFLDTPVKRYSSGMYVRLAFAVAAHLQSEILIVDEVLAVGDAEFQKKCMGKMGEVAEVGRTVLFVSHNMPSVQKLCNRVILLTEGDIAGDGSFSEVIKVYLGQGLRSRAERVWESRNTDDTTSVTAILEKARILNDRGETTGTITINQSFSIAIDYYNHLTNVRATAIMQIFNQEGTCIFSTNEFNGATWLSKDLRVGRVQAVCDIPGNLMAEGTFSVLIAVGSYNPNILYDIERNALAFEVVEDEDRGGVRGEFSGEWPGVVRPMLKWTSQYVDSKT